MKQLASSRQWLFKSMRRQGRDESGAIGDLGSVARGRLGHLAALLLLAAGCEQPLDAGHTRPHGLLPVDERSAVVITNDGSSDNWQGEYAMLLANGGGPKLAGIVVSANNPWPNLQ